MKLIFKYFFISLLFLNGQLVHAQSFKIDSLKGKKYDVTYHTVVNVINEYVEIGLEPTLTYKRNPNSNRKKKNAN